MDRKTELEIIKKTQKLAEDSVAVTEIVQWFENNVSEQTKLRIESAKWDAIGELPEIGNAKPALGVLSKQLNVLFMAAAIRCMEIRCPHVEAFGLMFFHAILSPRVLSCKECLYDFVAKFKKHDAERTNLDECDLCLQQGVKVFRQFSVAWNGILFSGDICPECCDLIKITAP